MQAVERRSNLTLAAFAAPCLPLAAIELPLVVYLPPFFHSEIGLSLAAVSTAWLVVRLLDLAFDPVFGGVMDRTRTRWGRFRFWFVVGSPVVIAGTLMLFMARPGVGVAYLWAGLILIYGGQSITTLAQMSWAAVLSPEYDQRSRIYAWWQAAKVLGMIIVLALPALLQRFAGFDHVQGVRAMGWFIIVLLPLTLLLSITQVPEPRVKTRQDRAGLREYMALFKRASVRRLLAADILISTGPAVTGSLFFFYFLTIKGFGSADAGLLLLFYFLGAFAGGPLWVKIAYRIGKHRALALAAIAYGAIQMSVLLTPERNFALGAALMFTAGLPFSAGPFLLRAMMADVADEERLLTGQDRTGLLYAILVGSIKIGTAFAVFVTYQALSLFGFNAAAGAANRPEALLALQVAFTALPALLALATAWVIWRYPLTADRQSEIRRLLNERDLADAAPGLAARPRLTEELNVPVLKPLAAAD